MIMKLFQFQNSTSIQAIYVSNLTCYTEMLQPYKFCFLQTVKILFLSPYCSCLDLIFNLISELFSCPFTPLSLSINLLGKTLSNYF